LQTVTTKSGDVMPKKALAQPGGLVLLEYLEACLKQVNRTWPVEPGPQGSINDKAPLNLKKNISSTRLHSKVEIGANHSKKKEDVRQHVLEEDRSEPE